VICFGEGKLRSISYYQRECARLGSRTAIRDVIHELEEQRLLVLMQNTPGKRATVVEPAERLLKWYAIYLSELRTLITKRLQQNQGSPQVLNGALDP
jgi:hypothetical protein